MKATVACNGPQGRKGVNISVSSGEKRPFHLHWEKRKRLKLRLASRRGWFFEAHFLTLKLAGLGSSVSRPWQELIFSNILIWQTSTTTYIKRNTFLSRCIYISNDENIIRLCLVITSSPKMTCIGSLTTSMGSLPILPFAARSFAGILSVYPIYIHLGEASCISAPGLYPKVNIRNNFRPPKHLYYPPRTNTCSFDGIIGD